jgi:hypothetical protein
MKSNTTKSTIPSISIPGQIAAANAPGQMNSFALAFAAMATRPTVTPKIVKRAQAEPQLSKIGKWFGKVLSGKIRLVPEKRLRVVESASLGERRFVAILQVEGQKFLIGGSSSNVSLLAPLEVEASTEEQFESQLSQTEQVR